MISVVQRGVYRLYETSAQTKIILLDKTPYAWINAKGIGQILVPSHSKHKVDCTLAVGYYRIYNVVDEPKLTDQIHLELGIGMGMWQGYLLPNGLPTNTRKRRIIPTYEGITLTEEAYPQESEVHARL